MSQNTDQVYKTRDDIVAEVIAGMQARIPDINVGPDSIFRIWVESFANVAEGLYLAAQLLHDDKFVQTANAVALKRYGEMYGRPQKGGTVAIGALLFSGSGGTFIDLGTEASAARAGGLDTLTFETTISGTIPNPGVPTAPIATDAAVSGALTGTYEYAVTFTTAQGETTIGAASTPLILSASKANLTAIPLGGPGTLNRKIYRRVNGGLWGYLATLTNNTATTYGPDNAASTGAAPPDTSTAERILLTAQATDIGADWNVAAGSILELANVQQGLSEVTNPNPFTNGTDEEDIEVFRSELLKYVRSPQSGSKADLESWAEAIEGVDTATAFPNINAAGAATPGTTTVRISGPDGSVPGAPVIAAVLADLQARDVINMTIAVAAFTAHNIATDVTLTLDPAYVLADVIADVRNAIIDYVNSVPVGGTVYRAGISHAVFGLAGIVTLVVNLPGADTTVAATEKPVASPTPVVN